MERLAAVAYSSDRLPLTGPYTGVFEELTFGHTALLPVEAEGRFSHEDGSRALRASLSLEGFEAGGERVDALWRGAIVARATPATGRISEVTTRWPSMQDVDAAIVASAGSLPSDPSELESARRAEVLSRFQADAADPASFDEAWLERWLAAQSVSSLGELLEPASVSPTVALRLRYERVEAGPPASPTRLPVAAAILVRDPSGPSFSLADLLARSRRVRGHMRQIGFQIDDDPALPQRSPAFVAWLVPRSWFDDDDWPGGDGIADPDERRQARIDHAASWLASESIGLVDVADVP